MTFFLLRFLYRPGALGRAALSKTESWRAKDGGGGGGVERGGTERGEREREGGKGGGEDFLGVGNLDQLQ